MENLQGQYLHQYFSVLRRLDGSAQDLGGTDFLLVKLSIGTCTLDKHSALDTDTAKQSLGFGVGEHRRHASHTCSSDKFSIASYGTCC